MHVDDRLGAAAGCGAAWRAGLCGAGVAACLLLLRVLRVLLGAAVRGRQGCSWSCPDAAAARCRTAQVGQLALPLFKHALQPVDARGANRCGGGRRRHFCRRVKVSCASQPCSLLLLGR